MKYLLRFTTILSVLLLNTLVHAQIVPPPFINYQAVLYDVNGPNPNAPYALQSFPAFVNISDQLGNTVYREEHFASTDQNGVVTLKMGDGLYLSGSVTVFNDIPWETGKYYLVVEYDINGTISATAPEQLVSVPYSFYSGQAGNGMTSVTDNGNGTLTFTYLDGSNYTTPTLSGIQGPTGATGPVGPQGPQGPAGVDGASAYDIWIAQGNTGTVEEFLSTSAYELWLAQGNIGTQQDFLNTLVGPQGPQGNDGATGPQGSQGIQGIQGPVGPQGGQGPQGPSGADGTNGTNGLNALIKTTAEPAGANCGNGGTKIETGLDADGNGTLDAAEVNVSQTRYVCDGGAAGTIGCANSIFIPDGICGATSVANININNVTYTVPNNKNFYLHDIYYRVTGGNQPRYSRIYINGILIHENLNASCGTEINGNIILPPGTTIAASVTSVGAWQCYISQAETNKATLNGFLVNNTVEALFLTSNYTVPVGKYFVRTNNSMEIPEIFPSGSIINATSINYISGYLLAN